MNFTGTSGYTPQPFGRETTFSLTVDGTDELMFVNGNLVIRHLSWNNPAALTINGVPQTLMFNGNLSDPIPLMLPDNLQFTQLGGRTTLYPVKTPVGLLIGADDELLGANTYTWKVAAVPEPTTTAAIAALIALSASGRRVRMAGVLVHTPATREWASRCFNAAVGGRRFRNERNITSRPIGTSAW